MLQGEEYKVSDSAIGRTEGFELLTVLAEEDYGVHGS